MKSYGKYLDKWMSTSMARQTEQVCPFMKFQILDFSKERVALAFLSRRGAPFLCRQKPAILGKEDDERLRQSTLIR